MGNLEKLGILVMVILVVVVGVVAITPQERVTKAFEDDVTADRNVEPLPPPATTERRTPARVQPPWPADDPVPAKTTPGGDAWVKSANAGSRNPRRPERTQPATLPPPRSTTYTVRDGDSLFSIAKKELGDGARWNEIVELNPALDPGDLRANDVLVLPRVGSAPAAQAAPAASAERTYVVKKGETLSGIASKQLGSARKWRALLDANRGLRDSPEDLREGMKITIPARSSGGGGRAEAPRLGPCLQGARRGQPVADRTAAAREGVPLEGDPAAERGRPARGRRHLRRNVAPAAGVGS
jgi:nucleoid-associated protein YgaU